MDGKASLLNQKLHLNLISIFKENAGQLSALNAAVQYLDADSQIFLLDSGDIYPPDYLEQYQLKLQSPYPDFVYCKISCSEKEPSKITTALCGDEDIQFLIKPRP